MPRDNNVKIVITAATKGVRAAFKGIQASMRTMRGTVDKVKASVFSLKSAFLTLGVGLAIRSVTKEFTAFDDVLRQTSAVVGGTAKDFDILRKAAREAGSKTRYSAKQAGEGLLFLAKAGFDTNKAVGALPSTLQLAAAGNLELGEAADIVTNIMSGYGKTAKDLVEVNDVMVSAFTGSNSNLIELGESFKYVGPIAKGLGVKFNDLISALSKLHDAGIKGSMAGTTLRGVLDALFSPTKEEATLMDDLSNRIRQVTGESLRLRDSHGNFVGFLSIVRQMESAGLRAEEALRLFGLRAGPGMAALLVQGSDALAKMNKRLDASGGTAKRIAEEMEAGLGGAWRKLKSAIEGVKIELLADQDSPLVELVGRFTDSVSAARDALITLKSEGDLTGWLDTVSHGFTSLLSSLRYVAKSFIGWKLLIGELRIAFSKTYDFITNATLDFYVFFNKALGALIPGGKLKKFWDEELKRVEAYAAERKKISKEVTQSFIEEQDRNLKALADQDKFFDEYYKNLEKYRAERAYQKTPEYKEQQRLEALMPTLAEVEQAQQKLGELTAAAKKAETDIGRAATETARQRADARWQELFAQESSQRAYIGLLEEKLAAEKRVAESTIAYQDAEKAAKATGEELEALLKSRIATTSEVAAAEERHKAALAAVSQAEAQAKIVKQQYEVVAKKVAQALKDISDQQKQLSAGAQAYVKSIQAERTETEKTATATDALATKAQAASTQISATAEAAAGAEGHLESLGDRAAGLASKYDRVTESARAAADAIASIPDGGKIPDTTVAGVRGARGMIVPGHSPSPTSDNIPALLTAGEGILSVDTMRYYGAQIFEALRRKLIPRDAIKSIMASGHIGLKAAQGGIIQGLKNFRGYAAGGSVTPMPAYLQQFLTLVKAGWQSDAMGWMADVFGGRRPGVGLSLPYPSLLKWEDMASKYPDYKDSPAWRELERWVAKAGIRRFELAIDGVGSAGPGLIQDDLADQLEELLSRLSRRKPQ